MNVQLLLLLALVGPFCAFTHASPTVFPNGTWAPDIMTHIITNAAVSTEVDHAVSTGHPTTESASPRGNQPLEDFTVVSTVSETDAPVTAATATPEPLTAALPVVETIGPFYTESYQPDVNEDAEPETGEEVVVEEGLSSGQVVGIVIGALLAVVIVIAVVIAVVRRMGKYSP